MSHNIFYSQICHKYIHIMGWKDQKRKEIATCGKFVSLQQLLWASYCWDAEGISCSFCAIAIQQHTVYCAQFTCSYRELHEMWHFSPRRVTKVKFFTPWYSCLISWKLRTSKKRYKLNCEVQLHNEGRISFIFTVRMWRLLEGDNFNSIFKERFCIQGVQRGGLHTKTNWKWVHMNDVKPHSSLINFINIEWT